MHPHGSALPRSGEGWPRLEVAEIFRTHGEVYRQTHVISPEQRAAMRAIEVCRTAALGGHVDVCDTCAFARPAYNSCRNRHCPKCQALTQAAWIDKRMEYVLPTHYFHVVFTLPHEIAALALRNRKTIRKSNTTCSKDFSPLLATKRTRNGSSSHQPVRSSRLCR